MRPVVTDGVAWCVCLSVCRNHEPCKNSSTDRDAIWGVDSGGSREHWTGKTLSARQMAGWKSKINNSSTAESELWRKAGPSAFQLQETALKSDKAMCRPYYRVINCVSLRTFPAPSYTHCKCSADGGDITLCGVNLRRFQSDVVGVVAAFVGAEYFRSGARRMRGDMRGVLLLPTSAPATTKLLPTARSLWRRRLRPLRMRVLPIHFRLVRV